jgi:hypothetical protein
MRILKPPRLPLMRLPRSPDHWNASVLRSAYQRPAHAFEFAQGRCLVPGGLVSQTFSRRMPVRWFTGALAPGSATGFQLFLVVSSAIQTIIRSVSVTSTGVEGSLG